MTSHSSHRDTDYVSCDEDDYSVSSASTSTSLIEDPFIALRNTHTNKNSLPFEADRGILEYISAPLQFGSFAQFCNDRTHLFGEPGSELRHKVKLRHQYLRTKKDKKPREFFDLLALHSLTRKSSSPPPPPTKRGNKKTVKKQPKREKRSL